LSERCSGFGPSELSRRRESEPAFGFDETTSEHGSKQEDFTEQPQDAIDSLRDVLGVEAAAVEGLSIAHQGDLEWKPSS
jgi:hypothetical protein